MEKTRSYVGNPHRRNPYIGIVHGGNPYIGNPYREISYRNAKHWDPLYRLPIYHISHLAVIGVGGRPWRCRCTVALLADAPTPPSPLAPPCSRRSPQSLGPAGQAGSGGEGEDPHSRPLAPKMKILAKNAHFM